MARLLITADFHGIYSVWQKILNKLAPEDILVIAGDLFGTRYPSPDSPDYQPEKIRDEYIALKNQKYLVYGNCDIPEFFPGQKYELYFTYNSKKILLVHGDNEFEQADFDIVIFGHTHVPFLKKEAGKLYLNPGSPSKPRGFIGKELAYSFALIKDSLVNIIDLKNDRVLKTGKIT